MNRALRSISIKLAALAYALFALAPGEHVLCVQKDGSSALEFGVCGKCLSLCNDGPEAVAITGNGSTQADPQSCLSPLETCTDIPLAFSAASRPTPPSLSSPLQVTDPPLHIAQLFRTAAQLSTQFSRSEPPPGWLTDPGQKRYFALRI